MYLVCAKARGEREPETKDDGSREAEMLLSTDRQRNRAQVGAKDPPVPNSARKPPSLFELG